MLEDDLDEKMVCPPPKIQRLEKMLSCHDKLPDKAVAQLERIGSCKLLNGGKMAVPPESKLATNPLVPKR